MNNVVFGLSVEPNEKLFKKFWIVGKVPEFVNSLNWSSAEPVPPPKVCRDFPYTMGCKSPIIAEVQGCLKLTADGIFGPKTLSGLQNGGYGNSITKEVYDKIKANCGKTDDNTTITTTSDIVNVEDGDKISF